MDYTSIHIYGHILSDDILRAVEQDTNLSGNKESDFGIDISVAHSIDYVWSSVRNDWNYFKERSNPNDPYGTRKSRDFMEHLLTDLGYRASRQTSFVPVNGTSYDITYLCPEINDFPIIVVGDKTGDALSDTLDKNSLDYRAKGDRRRKSPHATMLEYLNNTESVYGIVANGRTIRLIRNSGQLVKLTYIEFDLQRMLEEDKYSEFCVLYRLLHASRFTISGEEQCVMERYFNMSIESGNRIRAGLSDAVKKTMEVIGNAVVSGDGEGSEIIRRAIEDGYIDACVLNKELIHFIYRLLFLFIIEERNLVYQIPSDDNHPDYQRLCKYQEIYKKFYSASRLRYLSEQNYLRNRHYCDIWQGLLETFRLFESDGFGEKIGIKPLGGVLFNEDTLHYLKQCKVNNADLLIAFSALNEFTDERGNRVKINYSSLDVEEFGSVYEGILEMRPYITKSPIPHSWEFGYVGGLDRNSTSSYYTRPDLVQNLIKTTLEPVIKEKISKHATAEEKVASLLSMKVCDAASGSGHIVLAMARTIAWYVCSIRTGEDNPASQDYREALREVIQKCVYAVDYNPDAVELCKVVLWIEGYCAGKPLSFLDHHIRCGNSVVGVANLDVLFDGVPKEAFYSEDKEVLKKIKKLNDDSLSDISILRYGSGAGLQASLFDNGTVMEAIEEEEVGLATKIREINALPEDTLKDELFKKFKWNELMESPRVECLRRACDIYTYSFYKQFKAEDLPEEYGCLQIPYTRSVYRALEEIKHVESNDNSFAALSNTFKHEVDKVAREHRFFHWCLEFPEVFANGGFDVMCGNPPWDKLQMEEKNWFSGVNDEIANAQTQSARKKLIEQLKETDIDLYNKFISATKAVSSQSAFIKYSNRFKLTSNGKLELSSLFAELCLNFSIDGWGLVVPLGIAVNESNKDFFAKLIEENRLKSILCFENKEKLFDIDSTIKFCILSNGKAQDSSREVEAGFYLTRLDHLHDPKRIYKLDTQELVRLNPNTRTCSVFRTRLDSELTIKIYKNSQVLVNEQEETNPYEIRFGGTFNMSTDSGLFYTYNKLTELGYNYNHGTFCLDDHNYVPLYEGKMIHLYNHHYGLNPLSGPHPNNASLPLPSLEELQNPNSYIIPYYWIDSKFVKEKLRRVNSSNIITWQWDYSSALAVKDIGRSGVARTFVVSRIPCQYGVGHTATLLYVNKGIMAEALLQGMMSSLVFDFVAKQKAGGNHMSTFIIKQLPVIPYTDIDNETQWLIIKRVIKLCYFNHDLDGWAEELWAELNEAQRNEVPELGKLDPYVYDVNTRHILQSELDAIFAHLYGLNTDDLKYILDPEDVCGPGCINETFRVLKDNEIRKYGEYRTKRLVMEAWERFGYNR